MTALLLILLLLMVLPLLPWARPLSALLVRPAQALVNGAFAISAACGLLIALVQLSTVVMRTIFGVSIISIQESVLYLFAGMFLLASGAILLRDAHVRVDIFQAKWSAKRRAIIDLIGIFVFLVPVAALVLLAAEPYVLASWALKERSANPSGIHAVYLLKAMIPVFGALVCLAGFVRVHRLVGVLRGEVPDAR